MRDVDADEVDRAMLGGDRLGDPRPERRVVTVRQWFRMNRSPLHLANADEPLARVLDSLGRLAEIREQLRKLAADEFSTRFVVHHLVAGIHRGDPESPERQRVMREALDARRKLEAAQDRVLTEGAAAVLDMAGGRLEVRISAKVERFEPGVKWGKLPPIPDDLTLAAACQWSDPPIGGDHLVEDRRLWTKLKGWWRRWRTR